MQRYSAASCGSGVGSSMLGGGGARDTTRSDLSYSSSNIALSSRRPVQLAPYKPKCDRDFLNSRLGPPDFYPPAPNCPEETLTREAVQNGYKEAIEGIEEAKEITYTLVGSSILSTNHINRYKESIRKRLRAINDARVQKRKAGQVYGVPLSGSLLGKSGLFPEQRTYREDSKKKWIEDLSQPHKGLRSLAEHVPHGYRKKTLFEALIRHNVPLLRATWFIKITYLSQVRPPSTGLSAGGQDKTQAKRVEFWTKDVIDYLQCILDESCQNDVTVSTLYNRESPQMLLGSSGQHQGGDSSQTTTDSEEPSLYIKWCYMVRILYWHYAEGLLQRPQVIEWVLAQFQEKESLEALELLLPIVFEFIDSIALSQSHVRMFVDTSVRRLRELSPAGSVPDSKDHPREASIAIFLSELLCYLIVVVPDTFVALDCFPLPSCVCPTDLKRHTSSLMSTRDAEKTSMNGDISEKMDMNSSLERQVTDRELSIADLVSSIQKRAANLSKAVNPVLLRNNQGKVVQVLDKALISGDVLSAYHCVFEESFTGENIPDGWLSEISPCIRSSLRFMGALEASEVYAVFFLCEWATCDFRSCKGPLPVCRKFTGKKDFSRVYIAASVMKIKFEAIQKKLICGKGDMSSSGVVSGVPNTCLDDGYTSREAMLKFEMLKDIPQNCQNEFFTGSSFPSVFPHSHSPLHDAVVAWLDQHELQKGEGFKHLQVLLLELIRSGVFQVHAYARQLIISGIMDKRESSVDIDRANRHRSILEQLPAPAVFHVVEDVKTESDPMFSELIRIYSNERRFVLHGFLDRNIKNMGIEGENLKGSILDGDVSATFEKKRKSEAANGIESRNNKREKRKLQLIAELKHAISLILCLPDSFMVFGGKSSNMRSGLVQGKVKRQLGLQVSKTEKGDVTPGCEECGRSKRQKLNEEKGLFVKSLTHIPLDDEEIWWVRKGPKVSDTVKVEQTLKPTKQTARGRQKTVRKTQSLAQLAAARIENSQGASSSHICDSKVNCPYHKPSLEGEASSRIKDGNKLQHASDLYAIGKAMKRLRLVEKWSVASWLHTVVKQLIEGREKVLIKHSQSSGQVAPVVGLSNASDERSAVRWHLTEDEIAVILYILDISMDMRLVVKFLLWLLPKTAVPVVSLPSHGGRSMLIPGWNKEGGNEVGECLILSCLQRYENVLKAANLLPEALSVGMRRAAVVMAAVPGGRGACSAIVYVRNLLKKYGGLSSVIAWEKNFRVSSEQRLVAELEAYKTSENESTFGLVGVSGTGSSEECDELLRQKVSGRLSRISPNLKETVQRYLNKAVHQILSKEREHLISMSNLRTEKWDDGYQTAQHTIADLIELIRQNNQGDASLLVAGTVAAVVGNVGPAVVSMLDSASNNTYTASSFSKLSSIKCARRVVQIHIYCLRLLKEAMGECQSRMLEITLATEASSVIAAALAPGKAPRSQFQLSPETPDPSSTMANEILSNSSKGYLGKATKTAAAVAAFVVGSVVHGITSLERMVALLRIREGLEVSQFLKNNRSISNGLSRVAGAGNSLKADCSIEVYLYWFRVLISNCKTVSDGLVVNLLGESSVLALARMQHMLPLNSIFPPTYSIFSMVVWMPNFSFINMGSREDSQLHQALISSIVEAIKHEPIRDVCLRDTHALYNHLACDANVSVFAATLEMQGLDIHSKLKALLPLPGRLFLHAILDSQLPPSVSSQDEGNWIHGPGDLKGPAADGKLLVEQLVHVLDNLQPAKFHWQWVVLRLLLNEQVLIEKIGNQHVSAVDALQAFTPGVDNPHLSESEKTFTEIVLTRLLVRPDAAALYSEVVHMLGTSLEEYLIKHVKWVLDGVLGRKSLRQSLDTMAHQGGFSVKICYMSPWGWSSSQYVTEADKKKTEAASPEEGEVAEEGLDYKKDGKPYNNSLNDSDVEGSFQSQYFAIEKGLADLVLPCLARSSVEMRSTFAIELVKQMNTLEQIINMPIRHAGKSIPGAAVGAEGTGIKGHGSRKGLRGGSPGLGRRLTGVADPPSAAALQASMWLRLQFLLPLLRIILLDRDSVARNMRQSLDMRQSLAPVLLRLLGTRVVQEAVDPFSIHLQKYLHSKKEYELHTEMSAAAAAGMSGEGLFDKILSVLHALLSSTWASWLKPKATTKSPREVLDRDLAERMQAELDRMQLPSAVRIRLQAAMPLLPPSSSPTISCVPSNVTTAVPLVQSSSVNTGSFSSGLVGISQKGSVRMANAIGKCKSAMHQDPEIEIDPWTLLEDGTGSGVGGSNGGGGVSGDHANLKACNWLKGAVRVRRTDLTYVGAVDDDT